jgi:tRNA(fMet)-specific endonuclease VapC
MKYLLDTNICIYYLKGVKNILKRIKEIGLNNCAISEITVAELKYGIERCSKQEKNRKLINDFIESVTIIPIISSFDIYAKEKASLRKQGKIIDEFDLLIGCTAIVNDMILVTGNVKHFERLKDIRIENWVSNK